MTYRSGFQVVQRRVLAAVLVFLTTIVKYRLALSKTYQSFT